MKKYLIYLSQGGLPAMKSDNNMTKLYEGIDFANNWISQKLPTPNALCAFSI